MPYIPIDRRIAIDSGENPQNIGELTYKISTVIEAYRLSQGDRFQTFAECEEACFAAAQEFRRVVINPYEASKLSQTCPVHLPPQ